MPSEWLTWNTFAQNDTWRCLHYLPFLFNGFWASKILQGTLGKSLMTSVMHFLLWKSPPNYDYEIQTLKNSPEPLCLDCFLQHTTRTGKEQKGFSLKSQKCFLLCKGERNLSWMLTTHRCWLKMPELNKAVWMCIRPWARGFNALCRVVLLL